MADVHSRAAYGLLVLQRVVLLGAVVFVCLALWSSGIATRFPEALLLCVAIVAGIAKTGTA